MSPHDLGNKYCGRCKLLKTLKEFGKSSKSEGGRQGYCLSCNSQYLVERRVTRSMLRVEVTNKACCKCNETKSVIEFRRDNTTKDLLRPECKSCGSKYVSNRLKSDPTYKAHNDFRRLIKKFRTVGCDDGEVNMYRLVSKETYLAWLRYQEVLNDVKGPIDIDHRWPESRLDPTNPHHKLIGTNIINFAPMNKIENIKKSNKVVPELLLEQVTIAERFVAEHEMSDSDKTRFKFLIMVYKDFIQAEILKLLKEIGILV